MTSKKNYILIIIFFISLSIQAQKSKATQFGFRVSPNLTWMKIKSGPVEKDKMGLGFSYGVMMDKMIDKDTTTFLSVEAIITSMRHSISGKDSFYQDAGGVGSYYSNVNQDYKLQYLQIPISLKMKTKFRDGIRYYFQAGVAPGFLLSRNVRTTATPSVIDEDEWYSPNASDNDKGDFQIDPNNANTKSFSNNIGLFRVPLILGAGIEYNLSGTTAITAGLRWDNGFSDIFRDKNTNGINNYLGLSVGLLF